MLVFGGVASTQFDDTWIYDLSDNTWTEMNPVQAPRARQDHGMVYVPEEDMVVLFGGIHSPPASGDSPHGRDNDTWIYDVAQNTWSEVTPPSSPDRRDNHGMAYVGGGRALMYGGAYDGNSPVYEDTWIYDVAQNTWTEQTASPHPGQRYTLIVCPTSLHSSGPVLLFGGTRTGAPSTFFNDTWIYSCPPPSDTAAPVVEITSPVDGAVLPLAEALVEGSVSDESPTSVVSSPEGVSVSLPAGGAAFSGTVLLDEGENIIAVNATDSVGLTGGTSVEVWVDTVAPDGAVLSPAVGSVLSLSPVTLSIEVSDASSMTVDIAGVLLSVPAGTSVVSSEVALLDGSNSIPITIADEAGHVTSLSHEVVLDTTAPSISVDSPADGSCFGYDGSPVAVTVTVEDVTAVDVASTPPGVEDHIAGGSGVVVGAVDLLEGANAIAVSATDAAGNTATATVTIFLDTTAPAVATTSPAEGAAVRGAVDWHATAADDAPGCGLDRLEFCVDGILEATLIEAPFEIVFDTTALPDGTHELSVLAIDIQGNAATSAISILVDNTAPDVAIDAPVDGAWVTGTFPFEVFFTDGGSGVVSVQQLVAGAAPSGDASASFDPPLVSGFALGSEDSTNDPDGPLMLSVTVHDAAGNFTTASTIVSVDNEAPTGCVVQPVAGSDVSGMITVTADVSDPNLESLEILVDGVVIVSSPVSPVSIPLDTTTRLDGELELSVLARDFAGNTTTCSSLCNVDNLDVRFVPRTLNLKSKGKGCVHVEVEGINVGLLDPLPDAGLELRIPGGNSVTARFDCGTQGGDTGTRKVAFSRQDVIASVRAGVAAGAISGGDVEFELRASGGSIGFDTIKLKGS